MAIRRKPTASLRVVERGIAQDADQLKALVAGELRGHQRPNSAAVKR